MSDPIPSPEATTDAGSRWSRLRKDTVAGLGSTRDDLPLTENE